ncbi:MAG TPA: MMPL family transporter [Ilumatobacteraceae bacterium]|nr:MMPL family transporter [Ilumatobacteraceae bacterium]HRB03286.1 MMPL family transporter [Ilumatobacteraceae bacterium]
MSTVIDTSSSSGHEPSLMPDERALFSRLAASMARHRRLVLAVWLMLTVAAAPLALTLTKSLSGAGWDAKGSTAERVRMELRADFPALGAENPVVVFHRSSPIADDPSGFSALVEELAGGPKVLSVANPLSMPPDAGMISRDGLTALIPVEQRVGADADRPVAAGELGTFVKSLELPAGSTANVTGEWPVWSDFNKMNEEALHKAELLSGLPTLIMLFIAFGAMLAAGIPLVLAIAGIATGFATLHMLSWITPVSVWSMNFSMMIGLAVGIDYSLFIVSRYREERLEGKDPIAAIENTMSTSGKAVFLSALTVVLSLSAVFLVPVMVFQTMALGMIISVIAVALAALTLLPAVLIAMGDKVLVARGKKDPDIEAEGRWARWTGVALRRPGMVLAIGLVLLGALIIPSFGMKLGMPGARVVDEGRTSRDGYEQLIADFGPGAAAPAFVTVNTDDAQAVIATATGVANVVDARIVTEMATTGRVVVRVIPGTAIDDPATFDMVGNLRSQLDTTVPNAHVGGPAAQNHDLTNVLTDRAPYAIGIILIVAFMLLLVVFRSIVIATFSIVMNLLTVGAAFGFATIVFQHGFASSLIGFQSQGFVDAWAPLFFFALLFGLSMDYQLFLLAAIKERHQATGDTLRAVREGIARTGRPITNAAAIMIIVFIAFGVTGPIPPTELGLTLAMAVFLDATVVRVMLVPATMALLGEKSWYAPKWLLKILPHVNFKH